MCGISGWVLKDPEATPEESLLRAMSRVLQHRGPDQESFYRGRGIGLAHRRLSVIDLVTGDQPMTNENGTVWVVFNGEIYNFVELREGLIQKGHRFKTQSDTEVLVHLYEEKREAMVHDLRGMFAFAVWDSERREFFAARDRVGKKPFFYALWEGSFYFASEIKAILQVPGFPREVETSAVPEYFTYGYTPYPKTMFRHLFELPPAHTLTYKDPHIKIERYWRPSFETKLKLSEHEAVEQLWALLTEATRLRMVSDVPLGVFLSGGLDSSTVLALMAGLSPQPVKTFSIGFEESRFNELPYAREVARHFGADHSEMIIRPSAAEILPKIVWHYDQPFADSSALPSFYVSEMARRHVTVVLNGDGGDEIGCGYERYQLLQLWRYFQILPPPFRRFISSCSAGFRPLQKYSRFFRRCERALMYMTPSSPLPLYRAISTQNLEAWPRGLLRPEFAMALRHPSVSFFEMLLEQGTAQNTIEKFQELELTSYLPCDLLVKMDRATMAYGLEARSPMLDHRVIEFMASLPPSFKLRGMNLKYLLRKMMIGRLPPSILKRKKWGFGIPVSAWFQGELTGMLHEILLDPQTLKRPYFVPESIRQALDEHERGQVDRGHLLWTLLLFELWHRRFIDHVPVR